MEVEAVVEPWREAEKGGVAGAEGVVVVEDCTASDPVVVAMTAAAVTALTSADDRTYSCTGRCRCCCCDDDDGQGQVGLPLSSERQQKVSARAFLGRLLLR